jgi:hypothetical protein
MWRSNITLVWRWPICWPMEENTPEFVQRTRFYSDAPSIRANQLYSSMNHIKSAVCVIAESFHHISRHIVKSDKDWIHSVQKKEAVTIKCIQNGTSFTTDKVLEGRGILHNAAKCNIIGADFKVKPAQQTTTYQLFDATKLFCRNHSNHYYPTKSKICEKSNALTAANLTESQRQQKDILIRIYDPLFKK